MKPKQTRILLADDHLVVRMGIASIISFEKDLSVVGEAETGLDAVQKARELLPDIIIMDLMMPEMNGAKATAAILRENPDAKIIILTSFTGSPELKQAIDAGAMGVLDKDSSQGSIVTAIRDAIAGKSTISPKLKRNLEQPSIQLTPRQVEVLNLVAKGYTNREMAKILNIGIESVKDRLASVLVRLNASTRSEAVAIATYEHLI